MFALSEPARLVCSLTTIAESNGRFLGIGKADVVACELVSNSRGRLRVLTKSYEAD